MPVERNVWIPLPIDDLDFWDREITLPGPIGYSTFDKLWSEQVDHHRQKLTTRHASAPFHMHVELEPFSSLIPGLTSIVIAIFVDQGNGHIIATYGIHCGFVSQRYLIVSSGVRSMGEDYHELMQLRSTWLPT